MISRDARSIRGTSVDCTSIAWLVTKPLKIFFSEVTGRFVPGKTLVSVMVSNSSSNAADCGRISLSLMPCALRNATALSVSSCSALYASVRSGERATSVADQVIRSDVMRLRAEPVTLIVRC